MDTDAICDDRGLRTRQEPLDRRIEQSCPRGARTSKSAASHLYDLFSDDLRLVQTHHTEEARQQAPRMAAPSSQG